MRPLSPAPAPLPGALTLLQRLPGAAEAVLPVRLPTAARAARAGAQRDRDAAGRAAPEADGAGYAPLARVSIAAVGIVTPGRRCSSLHTNPACKPTPSGKYPICIHVLPCQVPTEPPTEPDPRGRLERHVPPSRVRPPPAGSAAPRPAWRSGGECENSSAPSAGATKSRHDHSSTGVGVPGGTAMRFDVGDRVLVHQQLVDSQQMHDAQQVSELVRAYVRPAGYDRPSMPMPTYLPTQAYDRRMASSHVSTDASSTNWQSRGAWGGTVERPPSLRALRLRRARPVALGVSTRPREKARRPSHCLGPRAGRLDRAPSGHPSPRWSNSPWCTPWHIQVVPRPRAVGRPPRGVLHRAVRRRRRAVRRRVRRPLGAARWYQRPRRHRWRRRAAHAAAAEPELRRDATSRLAVHAARAATFVGAAARIFPGGPWPQARRSARGRRLRRGAVRLRGRTRGSWSPEDDGWRLLSHRAELS